MFNLNFISEPGAQKESEAAVWSFQQKKAEIEPVKESKSAPVLPKENNQPSHWTPWAVLAIFVLIFAAVIFNKRGVITTDEAAGRVLNQVVDLIVEGSYRSDLILDKVIFKNSQAEIILRSDKMEILKKFYQRFYPERKSPYQIFQSGENYFLLLQLPWAINQGLKRDIYELKSLTKKTVFSNKVSLNYSENEFELRGRSADVISFLLNLAENKLIQEYEITIQQLKNGVFVLKAGALKS